MTDIIGLIVSKTFEIIKTIMMGYFKVWRVIGMILGGVLIIVIFICLYQWLKNR